MQVLTDPASCPPVASGHAVTIGTYDGVHLGHRSVIDELRRRADQQELATAVVTFDPHPAVVVRPESAPRLLTDLDQKLELLASAGVDTAVVVPFDDARAKESPEDFVTEVLVDCLRARSIVVGEDFHFGYQRRGSVELLRELGAVHGFVVDPMPLVARRDGVHEPVSSTAIRRALAGGDVEAAARMLGRPHEVRGVVKHGDQRGRTIGFPTANVALSASICLPADGVYAGWYERPSGDRHAAAINLGRRPTFYEHAEQSLLEAHLLDFDGDLYDEEASVEFVSFIRSERKFAGIDALVAELRANVEAIRQQLLA